VSITKHSILEEETKMLFGIFGHGQKYYEKKALEHGCSPREAELRARRAMEYKNGSSAHLSSDATDIYVATGDWKTARGYDVREWRRQMGMNR
jgi:hypothetical protein